MRVIVKTLKGLEQVLYDELIALGITDITKKKRAVEAEMTKEQLYKANYCLQTAMRILLPIITIKAKDEERFYNRLSHVNWSNFFDVNMSFSIDSTVFSPYFTHSHYITLRLKDAIVDSFRYRMDERPSIRKNNPDMLLNLHIHQDNVTISIDTSGNALYKRGYRNETMEAPINEILAAGLIRLSAWDKKTPLMDPMCGSGTLLTEAAMYAMNIPAQKNRIEGFGFEKMKDFDETLWDKVKTECDDKILDECPVEILGFDKHFGAVRAAVKNIDSAHLQDSIKVKRKYFEKLMPPIKNGLIIFNPPYDERLEIDDNAAFYDMIGKRLKRHYSGCTVWIVTPDLENLKKLNAKSFETHHLMNGSIEVDFKGFKIFKDE